jgi:hypothetical protein
LGQWSTFRGAPRLENFQSRNCNFRSQLRLGKIPPYSAAMRSNPASPLTLPRRQQGHSRHYILERLKREGLHAWVAAVASGKISCYAAACELGWTTRRPTKRGQNSNQSKRRRFNISKLIG